jgi:hypothetical protein
MGEFFYARPGSCCIRLAIPLRTIGMIRDANFRRLLGLPLPSIDQPAQISVTYGIATRPTKKRYNCSADRTAHSRSSRQSVEQHEH